MTDDLKARLAGIDSQVILAATELSGMGATNPEWLYADADERRMSFGRWPRSLCNPAPYVRLDLALARIAELEAERAKDHAEINIKADFIDATVDQLANMEARAESAEAAIEAVARAALEAAAHAVRTSPAVTKAQSPGWNAGDTLDSAATRVLRIDPAGIVAKVRGDSAT